LNVSPPTLTHQIQKLEKDLDARLLTRKTKMEVQLTQAGVRFLESARNVLHQAEEAELAARRAARGEVGRLQVGYMAAATYGGLVPRLIGGFQRLHPGIDISLVPLNTISNIGTILSNQLDAGFARRPVRYPAGLAGFPVYREKLMVVLPSAHPLARGKGAIDPAALADEPFVSTAIGYDFVYTRHVDAIAKLGGFSPKVSKRADDLTTVLTYVACGYGIAVVSREMTNCRIPNLTFKDINANSVPEIVLDFVFRSGETGPACRVLVDAMRAHAVPAVSD
jgi:DNA-binding transcriptional LysR family regulator